MKSQIWDNPFEELQKSLGSRYVFIHSGIEKSYNLPDSKFSYTDILLEKDLFTLLSWINTNDIEAVKELHNVHPEYSHRVVIDSGAFSVWNSGKEFDIDAYIDFLNDDELMDIILWAAEADVIPGKKGITATMEERDIAAQQSWDNYLYMISKVKYPKKILPIFHMDEDFKYLEQMLEYILPDGTHIPYIGISPRNDVSTTLKIKWYEKISKIIENSSNPNVLTHNFGMTSFKVMENFKSFSSDSTVCLQNSIRAKLLTDIIDGKPKFINIGERTLSYPDHYLNQSPATMSKVYDNCINCGHDITFDKLLDTGTDTTMLLYCNICAVERWAKNFKFKGNTTSKISLW